MVYIDDVCSTLVALDRLPLPFVQITFLVKAEIMYHEFIYSSTALAALCT